MKLKKKTKVAIRLFADSKELKPLLVLYQSLNASLKDSIMLFEISSLKDATLMCLALLKIDLAAIL